MVTQTDVPGPPSAPEVTETTKETCELSWKHPETDGGTPVIGFFIERSTSGSARWLRVNREPIAETTYLVTDLIEDTDYNFRIIAVNKIGEGEPGPKSQPVTAKDPWSKICICI